MPSQPSIKLLAFLLLFLLLPLQTLAQELPEGAKVKTEIKTYYIHQDHLGGTSVVTDESGDIVQTLDYYPYGESRIDEQAGDFESSKKFTGQEEDPESGLYYFNARYYDPNIGRFIGQDPVFQTIGDEKKVKEITGQEQQELLANPQRLNSYSYVENNPVNYIDPRGEYILFPTWRSDRDITTNKQTIINAASNYKDVSPEMVASVIYQERYGWKNVNPIDKLDIPAGILGIDTSIGLGQVKISTVEILISEGYLPQINQEQFNQAEESIIGRALNNMAIIKLLTDEKFNSECVAAYLQYHIDKWKDVYPEITNNIGVLATLYNSKEIDPHSDPQPSLDFGKRTQETFEHIKSLMK